MLHLYLNCAALDRDGIGLLCLPMGVKIRNSGTVFLHERLPYQYFLKLTCPWMTNTGLLTRFIRSIFG